MAHASPASRPFATLFLRLSPLIEVEIATFSTVDKATGVKRNQYSPEGNPVGNQQYDKVTGEVVDRSQVVSKIATEHGPVFVEDHEIESLFEIDPNSMTIRGYQPLTLIEDGTYVPNGTTLTVEAAKKKVGSKKVENKTGQQVLAGLLTAMEQEGVFALCEITTRGVPKPAALHPDGRLILLNFDDQVREPRPTVDVEVPDAAVQQIVNAFVKPNIINDPVDLTDVRSGLIQEYADEKAARGDFDAPAPVELAQRESSVGNNDDLMALLTASIAETVAS
jgi:non-homologous end joining protein Ku